jgi:fructoselysine-6-P-deglycase FrlB-like protein
VFASNGRTKALNMRLAQEIAEFGGKVVVFGEAEDLKQKGILTLNLPAQKELYAPLTEIVPVQLFSRRLAIEKGLRPGKFERAGKVTRHE